MADLEISVIVASFNSRKTIAATLDSLSRQKGNIPYEVIVVDSSRDGTAELVARSYPNVRLFRSVERKYPGDARNLGVLRARGDILAFTDADCTVNPDFVLEICQGHEADTPVIGGVIANGNPRSYVGWGHYFAEFSQWMPQYDARSMVEIPTGCLSVKRWAFEKYGPFMEGVYCSDTAFHWKMREDGHAPRFRPSLRVSHTNIESFGKLMRKQVFHGRSFARLRTSNHAFTRVHRAFYAVISPLLPFVLFLRTAYRVHRNGAYRGEFACTFPVVFLSLAAWSWGELKGYISGSSYQQGVRSMEEG